MLSATVQAYLCCRVCRAVEYFCPTCGEGLAAQAPVTVQIPSAHSTQCDCGTFITVQVVGFELNPTGEAPATESPLSDKLPSLNKALRQPAAQRSTPAKAGKTAPAFQKRLIVLPTQQQRPAATRPINPEQRFTLAQWAARGWELPTDLAPVTVSAAYRRLFGKNPPKQRATCLYTAAELSQVTAYIRRSD